MLQKVDKDRLVKVLSVIENAKIKFPNATISKDLERSSSTVSDYLNGKKPMSENFYRDFVERYEKGQSKDLPKVGLPKNGQPEQHLAALIEGNRDLSAAQKDVAATALKLSAMLEVTLTGSFNSAAHQANPVTSIPSLEKLAAALADKFGLQQQTVAVELGKLFYDFQYLEKV